MCGLVAVVSKNKYGFSKAELDTFELMLFMDTLRGEDSTGVFMVSNTGDVELAKQVGDGAAFLRTKEWKAMRNKAFSSGWALVGHNRKATRGSITDENAHPFCVDDKIVLVHNGYISNHTELAKTEVDSEAVAHALVKNKDYKQVIENLSGAFSFIWYDVEEKKLHFTRNNQRPLSYNANKDAIFVCSDEDFLVFAANKCGIKYEGKSGVCAEHKAGLLRSLQLQDDKSFIETEETLTFKSYTTTYYHGNSIPYKPQDDIFKEYTKAATLYDWEKPIEYIKFFNLRQKELANKTKISVEYEDFEILDENSNSVLVLGKYSHGESVFQVCFQSSNLDNVFATEPKPFEVFIDDHFWRKKEITDNEGCPILFCLEKLEQPTVQENIACGWGDYCG